MCILNPTPLMQRIRKESRANPEKTVIQTDGQRERAQLVRP